jgi:hypothetical protein
MHWALVVHGGPAGPPLLPPPLLPPPLLLPKPPSTDELPLDPHPIPTTIATAKPT